MKQKFFRGQRVKLADKFPKYMAHFEGKGCEAIVEYSYSDVYGLGNYSDFRLLILPKRSKSTGRINCRRCCMPIKRATKGCFSSAWYPEHLLTLISTDRASGEMLIQEHNERGDD